jgi:chromosome segregation ATPase
MITQEEFKNIFDEMHILSAWDHVAIDDVGTRLFKHVDLRLKQILNDIDNDHTEKLKNVVNALEKQHKKELQNERNKKIEGYEMAYNTLEREMRYLRGEIEDLKSEIEDLKSEIDAEYIENERLRTILKEKNAKIIAQPLDIPLDLGDIESIKF